MNTKTITQTLVQRKTNKEGAALKLSKKDKRNLALMFAVAMLGTALYWKYGGRNLFVFPASFCIAAVVHRYYLKSKRHQDKTLS